MIEIHSERFDIAETVCYPEPAIPQASPYAAIFFSIPRCFSIAAMRSSA